MIAKADTSNTAVQITTSAVLIIMICLGYWLYLERSAPARDERSALASPLADIDTPPFQDIRDGGGQPVGSVRIAGLIGHGRSTDIVVEVVNRTDGHLRMWGTLGLRWANGAADSVSMTATSLGNLRPSAHRTSFMTIRLAGQYTHANVTMYGQTDELRMRSSTDVLAVTGRPDTETKTVQFRWDSPYRYLRPLVSVVCTTDGRVTAAGATVGKVGGGHATETTVVDDIAGRATGASCGASVTEMSYKMNFKPDASKSQE